MKKLFDLSKAAINEEDICIEEESISKHDIAIIGISCEIAEAKDLKGLWDILENGRNCVRKIPQNRKADIEALLSSQDCAVENQEYLLNAYMEEIDKFDYEFFGISPKEASLIDPRQRIFLENAWKAIEDAGYGGGKLAGTRTGIYVGCSSETNDYKRIINAVAPSQLPLAVPGNILSILASRISYLLDLKGPSMIVDTACSSSLVAVHLACQELRNGLCEMAVAGCAKINLLPLKTDNTVDIGIVSKDGITRTFNDNSKGPGSGEGIAAILLKPLAQAIEDGDGIYAVIKGTAINQDGSSIGITAPNSAAQEDAILMALKDAGINPETLSFIEAHGTGTKLGDPVEIDGITRAFGRYTSRKQFCAIGSIKTNLGHLDCAAGMAGLLKAVLSLKKRRIPPHINFTVPNRNIHFESTPIYINTELSVLTKNETPLRCGVSSFGISGTNCHVILEEAPSIAVRKIEEAQEEIIALSAKSEVGINRLINAYLEYLGSHPEVDIKDLCFTANTGRGHYSHRLTLVVKDLKDLTEKLKGLVSNDSLSAYRQDDVYYQRTNEESPLEIRGQTGDTNRLIQAGYADHDAISAMGNTSIDRKEKLAKLCNLYIQGADIKWEGLYNRNRKRVNGLPVYPFERLRCWVVHEQFRKEGLFDAVDRLEMKNMPSGLRAEIETVIRKWQKKAHKEAVINDEEPSTAMKLNGRESGTYSQSERMTTEVWCEVLGYNEVNVTDDFYTLGGDSILALHIANTLGKRTGRKVEPADVLRHPTVESFAMYMDSRLQKENGYHRVAKAKESLFYPLSSAQKRLFLLNRLFEDGTAYNLPAVVAVEGALDRRRLEDAVIKLIEQHDIFKTSFEMHNGEMVQRINKDIPFELDYREANESKVEELVKQFIKPFNLSKVPLLRVMLIKVKPEKHMVVLDTHHIISDGTTSGIVIKELVDFYRGLEMAKPEIQYKDFAVWHNAMLESGYIKEQEKYWLDLLSDEIPLLNLPLDYNRPSIQSFRGNRISFSLDGYTAAELKKLAVHTGSTLYMLLLAAYNVLLHRYTGQQDIIVGSPSSGRAYDGLQNMVGMFVNTLLMRNHPIGSKTFLDFLSEVRDNAMKAYQSQDTQYETLVDQLNFKRDLSRNPIFDTMFIMQNMDRPSIELPGLKFIPYAMERNLASKYDITLEAQELSNEIKFTLEYCTDLFKKETVERMAEHFIQILKEVSAGARKRLSEINLLSKMETERLLFHFNNNQIEYPKHKLIHQLFEEQAEKTPEATALVLDNKRMSYRELNEKSNRLARVLRNRGIGPGKVAGILIHRSFEMFICVLAIVKAGGAFLPIDAEYPEERIKNMLEDSEASLLLTSTKVSQEHYSIEKLLVEHCLLGEGDGANLEPIGNSSDLAYIIYTSGSTGKPKGVLIEHRTVVHFHTGITERIGFQPQKSILALAAISFDIFILESFVPLAKGLRIIIADEHRQKDTKALAELIAEHEVDMIQLTPSRMQMLLSNEAAANCIKGLKAIMLGADTLQESLLELIKSYTSARIYNLYGPTETTVWSTVKDLTDCSKVTVGSPIANTNVYILDAYGGIQPMGVVGEIAIGGDRLARGYLNRPELTEEKFVQNPINPKEKIYMTGDLGRWLPEGDIEFLGRVDNQVKIRGYRIEIADIERNILENEAVKEVIVIAKEDKHKNKNLCAYYTVKKVLDASMLRSYLMKKLPDYMIPSFFIQLDSIPLSPNGKLDRKALPDPYLHINADQEDFMPRDEKEAALEEIWKKVLGLDRIGRNQSFFELGGNSISALIMEFEMEKQQLDIAAADIYREQTIEELSLLLSKKSGNNRNSCEIGWKDRGVRNNDNPDAAVNLDQRTEQRKKTEGAMVVSQKVEPFNDIFYKNCFYNSLFPIIQSFDCSIAPVLANDVAVYSISDENTMGVTYVPEIPEDRLLDDMGIGYEAVGRSDDLIKDIAAAIKENKCIILWIDCYYERNRRDTYQKMHWPHTWLIYGINERDSVLNVIEHKHRDNLSYEKASIDFDTAMQSYNGFLTHFDKSQNKNTYYAFYQKCPDQAAKNSGQKQRNEFRTYVENLINRKALLDKGLSDLQQLVNRFESISQESEGFNKWVPDFIESLNQIINAKVAEAYKLKLMLNDESGLYEMAEQIAEEWKYIRVELLRYVYSGHDYEEETFAQIVNKLREVAAYEQEYITDLTSVKDICDMADMANP